MTKIGSIASLVALVLLSAQATAGTREAAFATASDRPTTQTAMFVGGHYRLPIDGRGADRKGKAAFKFAGATHNPATAELRLSGGFEIARGQTGKAAMFIGGQNAGQLGKRMSLNGGETALLVVGGLVLIGGVLLLAGRESMDDDTLDW